MQGFSNTDELYLHHRGAWDKILHKRLAQIESDTISNAIVASVYTDSLHPTRIFEILNTASDGEVIDVDSDTWLDTTLYGYLPTSDASYRELLLEFLGDPIRVGKYILDGTKIATLANILMDYLIWPSDNKNPPK